MDVSEILSSVPRLAAEYLNAFAAILARPGLHFAPVPAGQETIVSKPQLARHTIDPKLFWFSVVSLCLSYLITSVIPYRTPAPTLIVGVIVSLVAWLAYAALIHLLCKALRGKGEYLRTLSACVQLFATITVISSVGTLLYSSDPVQKMLGGLEFELAAPRTESALTSGLRVQPAWLPTPYYVFFIFQSALLSVYLPAALRHLHRFGWLRTMAIGIAAVVLTVTLSVVLYDSYGVTARGPDNDCESPSRLPSECRAATDDAPPVAVAFGLFTS